MAKESGMYLVEDESVLRRILVGNYPEYEGNLTVERYGRYLAFKKQGETSLQVVMIS